MTASWLAYPLYALVVALFWLTLNQSLSPGHLLLGTLLGLFASFTLSRLQPPGLRPRNVVAILRLVGHVCVEIVRSNIAVGHIIVTPGAERKSGFLTIPLQVKDPQALAVLSCILTATPGSLWVNYDPAKGHLLMHILDLIDEETWVEIVQGYERRLEEIFR